MNRSRSNVVDLKPDTRLLSTEIRRDVFNRTYLTFIIVLMATMAVMGFTVSQNYETQKDLKELTTKYEINNIYLTNLKKEK